MGHPKVLASLVAAVVLLAAFIVIEARSQSALMPLRIFRNRDRSAANLIMLCIGTSMFGLFFFLTLFVQHVWGYSALKTGVAYLPIVGVIMAMAGISTQLVPRIGAKPLLIASSAIAAGGMFWLSRINEHSTYTGGLLGPMLVTGAGLGLAFMPPPWSRCPRWPTAMPAWPRACPTSASRSAGRSGWRSSAPWPGPW